MSFLYRYLIVAIACIAMLLGLQIPNFVDQYQKRLDAHLREVTTNLQPFQDIANKYLAGNLGKLIEMNINSDANPLQEEGLAIEKMAERKLRFETEMTALQTNLAMKILHIWLNGDQEILEEAKSHYSYAVPIDQNALVVGAVTAIIILVMAEILFALVHFIGIKIFSRLRRPHTST